MRLLLSSPAFDDKGEIPKKYGYKNKNSSPPLSISNVPSECKSLALIMDDPDAKKVVGKTWTHWLVWNIKSDIAKFDESSIPNVCIQGMTEVLKCAARLPHQLYCSKIIRSLCTDITECAL